MRIYRVAGANNFAISFRRDANLEDGRFAATLFGFNQIANTANRAFIIKAALRLVRFFGLYLFCRKLAITLICGILNALPGCAR
ncbi:MAG: hypothetical protein KJO24_06390 [Gammaproteobacteria bacterium]|nr:hypothetical protein [Gammaproteobacteria bacterium]